jgi:hypothetical protein
MDTAKAHYHASALKSADIVSFSEQRPVTSPIVAVHVSLKGIDIACQDKAMAAKLQADIDAAMRAALAPVLAWHKSQVAAALEG